MLKLLRWPPGHALVMQTGSQAPRAAEKVCACAAQVDAGADLPHVPGSHPAAGRARLRRRSNVAVPPDLLGGCAGSFNPAALHRGCAWGARSPTLVWRNRSCPGLWFARRLYLSFAVQLRGAQDGKVLSFPACVMSHSLAMPDCGVEHKQVSNPYLALMARDMCSHVPVPMKWRAPSISMCTLVAKHHHQAPVCCSTFCAKGTYLMRKMRSSLSQPLKACELAQG